MTISRDVTVRAINTLPVGAEVTISKPRIKGRIHGLAIYIGGNISYEVVYWHDSERNSIWVDERELDLEDGNWMLRGFNFIDKNTEGAT